MSLAEHVQFYPMTFYLTMDILPAHYAKL